MSCEARSTKLHDLFFLIDRSLLWVGWFSRSSLWTLTELMDFKLLLGIEKAQSCLQQIARATAVRREFKTPFTLRGKSRYILLFFYLPLDSWKRMKEVALPLRFFYNKRGMRRSGNRSAFNYSSDFIRGDSQLGLIPLVRPNYQFLYLFSLSSALLPLSCFYRNLKFSLITIYYLTLSRVTYKLLNDKKYLNIKFMLLRINALANKQTYVLDSYQTWIILSGAVASIHHWLLPVVW